VWEKRNFRASDKVIQEHSSTKSQKISQKKNNGGEKEGTKRGKRKGGGMHKLRVAGKQRVTRIEYDRGQKFKKGIKRMGWVNMEEGDTTSGGVPKYNE